MFLDYGADDADGAVDDGLRGLVQCDAVVDECGDLLGESVGFHAAVDDVGCLRGLQCEAEFVAARGGYFLGEGDVVGGLQG